MSEKRVPEPFENVAQSLKFTDHPCLSVHFNHYDQPTVKLVSYRGEKFEGDVAFIYGNHSERLARLFTAATDLLAASVGLIKWLDADATTDVATANRTMITKLDAIRAAIAKATGEPGTP